jgi:hypothetical protein
MLFLLHLWMHYYSGLLNGGLVNVGHSSHVEDGGTGIPPKP